MSPALLGTLRLLGESVAIFAVSIVILYFVYTIMYAKVGTGLGLVQWKGMVLVGVGILYLVLGFVLIVSPSILRRLQ
jgi:hypothetical protein